MSETLTKIVSWVDIAFKIALAIIAAAVSYKFGESKQQNEDIKLVVDLAFSPEPRTATAGVVLAGKYVQQKKIPAELYASIVASANSNGDLQLRDAANRGASAAAANSTAVSLAVNAALETLPVRVYFHISREKDRARAWTIAEALRESQFPAANGSILVPGIQLVNDPMTKTVVRCFKKEECDALGETLKTFLMTQHVDATIQDFSKEYASSTRIRPYHFEIWFGPLS